MNGMPSFANPANLEPMPEADAFAIPADASSLDFLRAVWRSPTQPMARRVRAAIEALPFEHPKLAVTALMNGDAFAAALERAIKRSGKEIERSEPLFEHHELAKPT